jgi:hypothetical protein
MLIKNVFKDFEHTQTLEFGGSSRKYKLKYERLARHSGSDL